jgi:Type IV pilin-like G and H, putative
MGDFYLRIGLGMGLVGLVGIAIGGCFGQRPSPVGSPAPSASVTEQPASASPSVSPLSPSPNSLPDKGGPTASASAPATTQSPSLLRKLKQDLSVKVAIAKQDTGKTALSNLLMSQQAEKLVKGRFTSDLKRLAADIPLETDEYHIEVRHADDKKAVISAIAKQPGFASYTGAVYAVDGKIPTTSICKTNVPSQTPPPPPKIISTGLICEGGSSTVN